jgi:hypothetical protein
MEKMTVAIQEQQYTINYSRQLTDMQFKTSMRKHQRAPSRRNRYDSAISYVGGR